MAGETPPLDTNHKPLVTCPHCASRLIYPLSLEPHGDGHMIIRRRCPECEHTDQVACDPFAVLVWLRRERCQRDALVRLVLDMEVADILGGAAPAAPLG
jgi:hypothetical protein